MPTPELPRKEALEGRVRLVHERAAPGIAEVQRTLEVGRLLVVEDVALAVVGRGAAGGLVSERGAPLDRQCLVGVDEGLADGQRHPRGPLEVDRDEGARHRGVAGEEQRPALLDDAGEAVAHGVDPEVGPVVAHPDDDGGLAAFGAARLAEVHPDQLDHVGLEEVDVPPGGALDLRQGARVEVEEGGGRAVDGLLRDPALHDRALHGGLAGGHVQDCKY